MIIVGHGQRLYAEIHEVDAISNEYKVEAMLRSQIINWAMFPYVVRRLPCRRAQGSGANNRLGRIVCNGCDVVT